MRARSPAWRARTGALLAGLLVTVGAPAATLREDMAALLARHGLTGVVWATVEPVSGVVAGAAGVADARSGRPLAPDARVQVGSVAKTVLAVGVLHLVSRGRLALDTPVSELLSQVGFDNPWEGSDPVRVRHLLDHTAGLEDARLWQVFSLAPGPDVPLMQALARDGGRLRVRTRPGSRFSYSNIGYTLAGSVVEAVTGQRYEAWLDQQLLRPLGMNDSSFGYVSQQTDPRLAMGHFEDGRAQAALPMFLRPAAQFTTTASDMGRFAQFLLGDGSGLIAPGLLRAMGNPADTETARAGLHAGYGLGLSRRDRHGALGLCHSGNTVGYRAMFCVFPAQAKAYFFSINTDSETADYGAFERLLLQALALPGTAPAPAAAQPADLREWDGWYVPAPNRFAQLAWLDTALNFAHLSTGAAGRRFAPFQSPPAMLMPVGGALWRAEGRLEASHALLVAADGRKLVSTGLQSYERVPLPRLALLWASAVAGALGLGWVLVSGAMRAWRWRPRRWPPMAVAFGGVLGLLLPLPLFYAQPFMALGDVTAASMTLALATGALPLAMAAGLWLHWRCRPAGALALADALAMLGVLQATAVLAAWGLWPLRLWA